MDTLSGLQEPDPLAVPGVTADTEALLKLRHLVRNIPERRLAPTGMPGGFMTRRRGRGLETIDIRVFSYGDDVRHVDHNTTARTGVTHVRTFHDERERTALLIADFRPAMLWGTRRALRSVAAAEALSLTGWRVNEAGGRAGLIAFGSGAPVFAAARGRERGMVAVIGGLAAAHRDALATAAESRDLEDQPLEVALEMAAGLVPAGGSVFLATGLDNPGKGFDALAVALNRRAALTVLLVTDAFERRAPAGSYPFISGQGRIRWALIGGEKREAAKDRRIEHLTRLGIVVVPVDASAGPEVMADDLARGLE
ncbi:DUF58 domain-containing protein [Pelagibius sp. Alg239-R121]|uniref:DUF58 domain-containing protein n=1 Tax=Pelagibius sp. Alg239-R121 TaxID=2993448 RepID=UPI0024A668F2|nr:DUF58 domain-containing protein [Pelagibius sp. Alg239-R121]